MNSGGACLVVTVLVGTGALIGVILALGDAAYEVCLSSALGRFITGAPYEPGRWATLFVGTALTSNISSPLTSVASSGFSFKYESTSDWTQTLAASRTSADSWRHSRHSPLQLPDI